MQLQTQITIQRAAGDAFIQLLHGDLSAIPAEHETDIGVGGHVNFEILKYDFKRISSSPCI